MTMRRPKREIKDMTEICKVIDECSVCRIGLCDKGSVYIVPMNFGYLCEDRKLTFYLHSSKVGRKMEVLRENPDVGIELDCRHGLMSAEKPCSHSFCFASLIGTGRAVIEEDAKEKLKALKVIMKHQTGKDFDNFDEKWINAVAVIKVELEEYACKHHDGTN
ncbi:MFS transporter [Lachnospiraceae bacterium]|nr:MFS transporter [Lachnospiraceae bacterium]BDF38785.1 MFS transporter [Lachnospiraceae bacterium]